jgi:hypothetical protein
MHRLDSLDLPGRLSGIAPPWAVMLGCAVFGVGVSALLRLLADQFAPGVAPYAFVYPACLLATLLGGWQAGLGTVTIGGFLAWEFVVPKAIQSGGLYYQAVALVINAITATCAVTVAEGFRVTARQRGHITDLIFQAACPQRRAWTPFSSPDRPAGWPPH